LPAVVESAGIIRTMNATQMTEETVLRFKLTPSENIPRSRS
jgi:hypothetical protein